MECNFTENHWWMVPDTSLQALNHLLITLFVNYGVDCKFAINKQQQKYYRLRKKCSYHILLCCFYPMYVPPRLYCTFSFISLNFCFLLKAYFIPFHNLYRVSIFSRFIFFSPGSYTSLSPLLPVSVSLPLISSYDHIVLLTLCRSQRSRGLSHGPPSPARTLGSYIRIPLETCMYVCVNSVFSVLPCVDSGIETDWSSVQEILPTVYRLRNWKSGQVPQGL
jgi:hypothetical protein